MIKRLRLNEEIMVRIKAELERVVAMVKTYNAEGLLTRVLELEKLISDMDA